MYRDFVPHARRLLTEHGVFLTYVDVGSRNGILELADVPEFVDAYGFEPNPEEYEKLLTGHTDASLVGAVTPSYRTLEYSPLALGSRAGSHRFYVTAGRGAAGLLEPNMEILGKIKWKGNEYAHDFAKDVFTVERELEVQVLPLRDFATEHGLDHIDYLKIDVEGMEYDVLEGAADLLDRTGVIKVEVCFIEFRHGQRLFSDVDVLLRTHGMQLLRYEILPEQVAFKERTSGWSFGPTLGFPERYGQPIAADAIYVNERIADPGRALAQVVVLLDRRYLDEALHVLRRRAGLGDDPLASALSSYRGTAAHRVAEGMARAAVALKRMASPSTTVRSWLGWRRLERRGVMRLGKPVGRS